MQNESTEVWCVPHGAGVACQGQGVDFSYGRNAMGACMAGCGYGATACEFAGRGYKKGGKIHAEFDEKDWGAQGGGKGVT
eukprot:414174-Amphidinium_carterae.1